MISLKNKISAVIAADSINSFGDRITTLILTMPRFILAELNTHRMLSKNSASSRAIPFKTMYLNIWNDHFKPIKWQKDHKGMQGSEYFEGADVDNLEELWVTAAKYSLECAKDLNEVGLSKQFCNRIIEPFAWHRVLVTATEWDNFVGLRSHKDAEMHINELSDAVLKAMNESTPNPLKDGEWHLPFGDTFNDEVLRKDALTLKITVMELKIAVAIARCARVSYDNFNGSKHDYLKDYDLFKKLFISQPIHASPSEHVAYAMSYNEYITNVRGQLDVDLCDGQYTVDIKSNWDKMGYCRNFRGWVQYRTLLESDTIWNDERLIKKK